MLAFSIRERMMMRVLSTKLDKMCGEPDLSKGGPAEGGMPQTLLPFSLFYHSFRLSFPSFTSKMIRSITLPLFLLMVVPLPAQFYLNASDQLPDDGAKEQSMDIRAADLDNDGDLDVVLANEGQPNTILFNDGNGNFTLAASSILPARNQDSEDVAIADFNGDGWLDLVFCSEDDVVLGEQNVHEYYLGSEAGTFTAGPDNLVDSEANAVISADINNDGWPDLVFGNNGPSILLLNDQTGSFIQDEERIPAINRTTQDLLYVDLNADGHPDLIEGNENGNRLYINDGNGFFTDETSSRFPAMMGLETRKVVAGDVDGDNDLDLFLCNVAFLPGRNPQNRLFLNDGTGVFTDATNPQLPTEFDHTLDALLLDMDADGDLDLFVANIAGVAQKVYRNDGNGSFSIATPEILGENYVREGLGFFAADFNGDELIDIYLCDRKVPTTNNKDLLLLRTSATFTEELTAEKSWRVYPNPVQDTIYIRGLDDLSRSAHLSNATGQILAHLTLTQQTANTASVTWPQQLPAGTYFLNIGEQTVKLIKQ